MWMAQICLNGKMLFRKTQKCFSAKALLTPGLEITDITALNDLKVKHNLILAVDNCFATPIVSNPADLGADLVVHSATKYIDGQGRVLGGVICGKKDLIAEIRFFARHTGPSMSPFNAWILSKSIETLQLRVEKHCENALKLAQQIRAKSSYFKS